MFEFCFILFIIQWIHLYCRISQKLAFSTTSPISSQEQKYARKANWNDTNSRQKTWTLKSLIRWKRSNALKRKLILSVKNERNVMTRQPFWNESSLPVRTLWGKSLSLITQMVVERLHIRRPSAPHRLLWCTVAVQTIETYFTISSNLWSLNSSVSFLFNAFQC